MDIWKNADFEEFQMKVVVNRKVILDFREIEEAENSTNSMSALKKADSAIASIFRKLVRICFFFFWLILILQNINSRIENAALAEQNKQVTEFNLWLKSQNETLLSAGQACEEPESETEIEPSVHAAF
jgi:hypothetical protein